MTPLPKLPAGLPDDELHQTATLLNSVAVRLLRRIRESDRRTTHLTAARASLLSVLVFGGPRSVGDLAEIEQVTPPAATKLIDALETDGLVERKRSTADRRIVEVAATSRGHEVLERGRAARVTALAEMLAEVSPRDLATVRRGADRLADLI